LLFNYQLSNNENKPRKKERRGSSSISSSNSNVLCPVNNLEADIIVYSTQVVLEIAREAEIKSARKRPRGSQKKPISKETENKEEDNDPTNLSSGSECESVIVWSVEHAHRGLGRN
jgi:hypothetical protein